MAPQPSRAESQFFCNVPCSNLQCFLIQGDQWQHVNLLSADNSTLPSIFSTKMHFDDLLLFSGKLNAFSHHFQSFNFEKMFIVQNASLGLQNLPSFYIITLQSSQTLYRLFSKVRLLRNDPPQDTGNDIDVKINYETEHSYCLLSITSLHNTTRTLLNWILEGGCIQLKSRASDTWYFRLHFSTLNCDVFCYFHYLDEGQEEEEIHKKIFRKWINFKLAMVSLDSFKNGPLCEYYERWYTAVYVMCYWRTYCEILKHAKH